MIYRAIQLIQIFLADGRTDELTKVIQEVLADLKSGRAGYNTEVHGWESLGKLISAELQCHELQL